MNDTSTPKNESGKKMFTFKFSLIEEHRTNGHDEQSTMKVEVTTKRLGMDGPVQKIRKDKTIDSPSVNVHNIAASMGGSTSVTLHTIEKKQVIVWFRCTLCKKVFFTSNGYDYHIFTEHQTRKREDYPSEMIQEHDVSITSSGEASDVSSLPNIIGPSQCTELKHKTKTYMIDNPEEKCFQCEMCTECFYYEKNLRTHLEHAHTNKENQHTKNTEKTELVREVVNEVEHIETDQPKKDFHKGRHRKQDRMVKKITMLSDQKIQPDTDGTTFRQTRSQSKVIVALTEQKEREHKEKLALESSTEMTKEDHVKVYSLRPHTSQISVKDEKKIPDVDQKIDVPQEDGNDEPEKTYTYDGHDEPENTDTLVGENSNGTDDDPNEGDPVMDIEIPPIIEQDNSGELKPDDANNKSSGGISSENTAPEKGDRKNHWHE